MFYSITNKTLACLEPYAKQLRRNFQWTNHFHMFSGQELSSSCGPSGHTSDLAPDLFGVGEDFHSVVYFSWNNEELLTLDIF